MNKGIKVLGAVVLVGAAAAIAAPFALQSAVTETLRRRVEAATGLPTQIGSARLGFFPAPHLEASDIRIGGPRAGGPFAATVAGLRLNVSIGSLFGGAPEVSDIVLDRPAVIIVRGAGSAAPAKPPPPDGLSVDGLTVNDGSLAYIDDSRQARLDLAHLSFRASLPSEHAPASLAGSVAIGGRPYDWRVTVQDPGALRAGRETAADAQLGTPKSIETIGLRGHVRLAGDRIEVPDLAATGGGTSLSGSGSIDFTPAAPLLTAAIKVPRLDVGDLATADPGVTLPIPADRSGLRLTDAAVTVDIEEAAAGSLRATAIRSRLTLTNGLLRLAVTDAKLYDGTVRVDAAVDAAQALPRPTVRASVSQVDLSQLLAGVAPPTQFTGRLDAAADLSAAGATAAEMVPNLAGTARLAVTKATVTGIDVPSYIRSVATYLPAAWQQMTNRIDVQSLTASFQIAQGIATTADFHAVSPVVELNGKGTVDLNAHSVDLSFDPKVSAAPAVPGKPAPPNGALGVAILVQGPWSQPRMSADLSNAMRDPQQTLDTLQTLGQQMFGGDKGKGGGVQADDIMKGLGGLFGGMK
jgi:AsmA protein